MSSRCGRRDFDVFCGTCRLKEGCCPAKENGRCPDPLLVCNRNACKAYGGIVVIVSAMPLMAKQSICELPLI